MAASNLDKFKKAKRKFETTVGVGGILAGGTTLPLTSVTGLDTTTAVTLVVGAGTATEEVITGVVSGSDLINCVRGKEGTTDSAHSAGESVNMYFTETHWDDAMDGILADHKQDGTHSDINADSITATTGTFTNLTIAGTATPEGWIPGTGTWTYASATTFTVPAADAALMSVGTKIWLTQTTSKYFYVTGVSGTTITVTGGSDYTVANAAITAPYFSNAETPVGFPQGFNFTMAISAAGGSPAIGNGTSVGKFILRGKLCTVTNFKLTVGSSTNMGTGAFYLGYPITPSAAQYATNVTIGTCYLEDTGVNGYSGLVRATVGISAYFTMICHAIAGNGRALDISGGSGVPFSFGTSDFITGNYTYEVA